MNLTLNCNLCVFQCCSVSGSYWTAQLHCLIGHTSYAQTNMMFIITLQLYLLKSGLFETQPAKLRNHSPQEELLLQRGTPETNRKRIKYQQQDCIIQT